MNQKQQDLPPEKKLENRVTDLVTRFARCLDFRQTQEYAKITESLGWEIFGSPGSYMYLKHLGPVAIAKIQRPTTLNLAHLTQLRKKHHIFWTYVEPGLHTKFIGELPKKPWYVEPYAHSATALIDLTETQDILWQKLSTDARTKIRRAAKDLTLTTTPLLGASSQTIDDFLSLGTKWGQQKQILGYEAKYVKKVIDNFKEDAYFVSAYCQNKLVSEQLLIKQKNLVTAFCIFTTPLGYRLRAPLFLNWHALLASRKLGGKIFDFFGLYDPRYHQMYKRWQGFSATKMLFKPALVSFPRTFLLLGW